jgi:hypothetical protein
MLLNKLWEERDKGKGVSEEAASSFAQMRR